MRSHPEIGIWELVSRTPCFGPHLILGGQNPLTAWYPGPDTSSLAVRAEVIYTLHDRTGYAGRESTYNRIAMRYYWEGCYKHVATYIKTCRVC